MSSCISGSTVEPDRHVHLCLGTLDPSGGTLLDTPEPYRERGTPGDTFSSPNPVNYPELLELLQHSNTGHRVSVVTDGIRTVAGRTRRRTLKGPEYSGPKGRYRSSTLFLGPFTSPRLRRVCTLRCVSSPRRNVDTVRKSKLQRTRGGLERSTSCGEDVLHSGSLDYTGHISVWSPSRLSTPRSERPPEGADQERGVRFRILDEGCRVLDNGYNKSDVLRERRGGGGAESGDIKDYKSSSEWRRRSFRRIRRGWDQGRPPPWVAKGVKETKRVRSYIMLGTTPKSQWTVC